MSEQPMMPERLPAVAQPMAEEQGMTIDVMEILYRLLASWKLILCLALIGAVGASEYTKRYVTPMYRATSTIYVVSSKDSVINMSDLSLGSALTGDFIKLFSTWEIHEAVASNLNLPYTYNQLRGMLSVQNPSTTRMLDLTVTSASPQEAAALANEYANVGSEYIAKTMRTDKPSIMSVALVPANPIGPNKTRNIMTGFLAGAALAAAFVVLRVILDDKIKTADEIRKYTGLPTLAVIPVEEGGKGKTRRKERKKK